MSRRPFSEFVRDNDEINNYDHIFVLEMNNLDWPSLMPEFLTSGHLPKGTEDEVKELIQKEKHNFYFDGNILWREKLPYIPFLKEQI